MAIVEFLESNSIDQVRVPNILGSDKNSLCLGEFVCARGVLKPLT